MLPPEKTAKANIVIPLALVEAMKRGEAILFLGAGASYGASRPDGQTIPMGNDLRDRICDQFLSGLCKDRTLDEVASLAENTVGRGDLDTFVANCVRGFAPTSAHSLLPTFRWKAIFGLNYDTLVEAAYEGASKPLQSLKPFYRDAGIEKELATAVDPIPYYKLHGTVDHLHDREAPLILTQETYLTPKQNRRRLFGRMEDLASEYPVIFVGTRLADHHIREMLHTVELNSGSRPTYFFVAPDINTFDEQLLSARRMTPIRSTFGEFMKALDETVEPIVRQMHSALPQMSHSIERHFRRRVSSPPSLSAFLTENVEHVHSGLPSSALDAELFFRGESASWDPIEKNYDIERQIYTTVMLRLLDINHASQPVNIISIRGVAGAGKTVFGRRLAYDLAIQHGMMVLFGRPGVHLRADPLLDLYNLTGLPIVIVIDQAADQLRSIEEIVARLVTASIPITMILLDTNAAFGSGLDPFSNHIRGDFELRNLTAGEITAVLSKLELHRALGLLEPMSPQERTATFEGLADRQLLVALYEATHGKPLEQLLVDEFHRIVLTEAQELYLLVCTLHRFNIPVRAGLVKRVMGIGFHEFEKRFLEPLKGMVFAEMDPRSRDYAYRARHAQIAEIVFRRVLNTQTKQSEQYIRILEGMNPSYESDLAAMRKMLSSRSLRELSPSLPERRRILAVAEKITEGDPFVLQQRAILEMNTQGGDLDLAATLIETAIEVQPKDPSLKHTQASLFARRAKLLKDQLARRAMRNKARTVLRALRASASDPYVIALKATLAIDDLEDLLKGVSKAADGPADPIVLRLVEDAERALDQGLSTNPEFENLARESFRLKKLMGEKEKGLNLLKRTLANQPHLEFVAVTYARAVAERDLPEALGVIRRCLAEKPQSRLLNQVLFELMLMEADDFRDALSTPLRKSFSPGDGNIPMHVHAIRHYFFRRERDEYSELINAASGMKVRWADLERPRFPIDGPKPGGFFEGTILKLGGSSGTINTADLIEKVRVHADNIGDDMWERLREGMKVSFRLWFNGRGPVALEVHP